MQQESCCRTDAMVLMVLMVLIVLATWCLPHACICRFTEFGFAAKSVVKEFSSTLVTKSHLFAAASGRMQHAL